MEWIPTTERMPDPDILVIAAYSNRHGAYDYETVFGFVVEDMGTYTHWMRITPPTP